jgi:hypothetical protein
MLKRWRLKFDPTTEYFSFRHLWVLLPGLSLQLWNTKAMEAIGNVLGRFIKIDEDTLHSRDMRMEKILVEVDVHGGVLETLDIEWRDMVFAQRLDYLGISFRCSRYRQTGHIRKDCHHPFGVPFDESPSEETVTNGYSPEMEALELVSYPGVWDLDNSPSPNSTFVGKLRLYVPSLYCSLTGWERDHLDSFYSVETFVTGVTDKIEALVSEPKVLAPNSETVSTTPVTCLYECRASLFF